MDDDLKNPFDNIDINKEIENIQLEIDKDLNSANTSFTTDEGTKAEDAITEQNEQTEETAVPASGVREVVVPENEPEPCAPATVIGDSRFFKETVKNGGKKGGFKRAIAMLCVVSILGGGAAGAMFALASQVIIPAIRGESGSKANHAPEFKFEVSGEPVSSVDAEPNVYPSFSDSMSFAGLIDTVEPSVVCISAEKSGSVSYGFFNVPGQASQASGIIFDKDNEYIYIVSNNHVTDSADKVYVSVQGCEPVEATLVGKESKSDLVVISVLIKDLKDKGINNVAVAKFGSSKNMRVGDFAIAIGNALGEGNTATFGFISATDKEVKVDDKVLTVIQTDAAINPGNSGGPLINLNGEVIGINTLKLNEVSVEGMGYCITSDVAMPIIEQLRNKAEKPMIGIRGYTITEQIAQAYNLPPMGVVVDSMVPGSPAEKAGIQKTDIITSFDGETVITMEQLTESIQSRNVGDKVEITLLRNGKDVMTFTVTLTARAEDSF